MTEVPALIIRPDDSRGTVQRQLARVLEAEGSEAGMMEARMILCAALGLDHAAFLRDQDRPIGAEAAAIATEMAARRARHEPISRILGHREFFGLDFVVDDSVIVAVAERWQAPLTLLDLGTGSGAILSALLASFPYAFGVGVDRSEAACKMAKKNLAALGFARRGAIVCGHWGDAIAGSFDVIVSNPPYIAQGTIADLDREVRDYDPHLALDGGADGYDAYRAIIPVLPYLLAPDGVAVFELGQGQGSVVKELLESAGLQVAGTRRDLAGIERAIGARRRVEDP
jgi:release factor glutamine methyltransferase